MSSETGNPSRAYRIEADDGALVSVPVDQRSTGLLSEAAAVLNAGGFHRRALVVATVILEQSPEDLGAQQVRGDAGVRYRGRRGEGRGLRELTYLLDEC